MTDPKEEPKRGMLVEDSTVVGGTDQDGATTISPKTVEGAANESVTPTDAREAADNKSE